MDQMKLNKILPSLARTRRVSRTDSRGRNRQQPPFKDSLKRKSKKKEKDMHEPARAAQSEILYGATPRNGYAGRKAADKPSQSSDTSQGRSIDIRV